MSNRRSFAQKPLESAKTVVSAYLVPPEPLPGSRRRHRRRSGPAVLDGVDLPEAESVDAAPPEAPQPLQRGLREHYELRRLVREWLQELKVMGRSPRTLDWYQQKWDYYLDREAGPHSLEELTSAELKRLLACLQERGLAPNTIHGFFEVIRAFANWALREGYPVDLALVRMRPPKVPQQEMETYTETQLRELLLAAAPGWPRLAVQILLGTGMRLGELVALELSDYDDDGEVAFLRIRRGKGAKFRRVPVSSQLRREIDRYVNRLRPDSAVPQLLVLADGRPLKMPTVMYLFRRLRQRTGFRVHAHKFRHTFATGYLQRGGEIERLRRILGHTSYVMVMRYLHLDKNDLGRDFDSRAPF